MNIRMPLFHSPMDTKNIYWGVFIASFLFYFGFSHLLPVTDPVESNYALTAKEMVQAGDWLSPRIYGNVWYDKPVFFYWLTAIAFKFFGFSELAARLAPAFFAALGLVLIYWFAAKLLNRGAAFWAVLIMGTSLEYTLLAKLIITDMVFFVFNSAALVFFYLGYVKMDGTKRWYLGMYASLALAVLTKGPIGVLLPGLVIVLFLGVGRNWAELKHMSIPAGILIFALIALPWYAAMYAVHGTDFLDTFLGVHNYLRATVSEHPKDNVSYYYIAVFFLSMLPWSFLAVRAFIAGYQEFRLKFSPLGVFCSLWIAAYFGFYSLMATKYLTYTFPILFPAIVLTARYLDQVLAQDDRQLMLHWVGIPVALLMIGYIIAAFRYLHDFKLTAAAGSLAAMLLLTGWLLKGREAKRLLALLCICQLVSFLIVSVLVLPDIAGSRSGKGIAGTLADNRSYRLAAYHFYSTSLVFYNGTVAVKIQPADVLAARQSGTLDWSEKYTMPMQTLAEFMSQSQKALIVVPDKIKEQFNAESQGLKPELVRSKDGFSYYYFTADGYRL